MRSSRGVTLIELLVTIAVIAILSVVAVPSFQNFIRDNTASSEANKMLSGVQYARSEALRLGVPVTFRVVVDDSVWCVHTAAACDDATRLREGEVSGGVNTAGTQVFTFNQRGERQAPAFAAGATVNMTVTPTTCAAGENMRRVVAVNIGGRVAVNREVCP